MMTIELAIKIGEIAEVLKELALIQAFTLFVIVTIATIHFIFYRR